MAGVILPSMTDQMVLAGFRHLVECELRKHVPGQVDLWFGNQEGWIVCCVMMFGQTDDESAGRAFNSGGSWLQLTEKIVQEKLVDWVDELESLKQGWALDEVDFEAMQEAVDKAVNEYALQHPKSMSDALKKNL